MLSFSVNIGMEDTFIINENTLNDLSAEIEALNKEMTALFLSIQGKQEYYSSCKEVEPS